MTCTLSKQESLSVEGQLPAWSRGVWTTGPWGGARSFSSGRGTGVGECCVWSHRTPSCEQTDWQAHTTKKHHISRKLGMLVVIRDKQMLQKSTDSKTVFTICLHFRKCNYIVVKNIDELSCFSLRLYNTLHWCFSPLHWYFEGWKNNKIRSFDCKSVGKHSWHAMLFQSNSTRSIT